VTTVGIDPSTNLVSKMDVKAARVRDSNLDAHVEVLFCENGENQNGHNDFLIRIVAAEGMHGFWYEGGMRLVSPACLGH
jgi:hypothetical protein